MFRLRFVKVKGDRLQGCPPLLSRTPRIHPHIVVRLPEVLFGAVCNKKKKCIDFIIYSGAWEILNHAAGT